MACIVPPPLCQTEDLGSQTLQRLAKQLQFYTPPKALDEELKDHEKNEELSFVKLRQRRAAVLICLFECPEGELRVILTRRSRNLTSHPGKNCVTIFIYCVFLHFLSVQGRYTSQFKARTWSIELFLSCFGNR